MTEHDFFLIATKMLRSLKDDDERNIYIATRNAILQCNNGSILSNENTYVAMCFIRNVASSVALQCVDNAATSCKL
jgi:hypothetical protein